MNYFPQYLMNLTFLVTLFSTFWLGVRSLLVLNQQYVTLSVVQTLLLLYILQKHITLTYLLGHRYRSPTPTSSKRALIIIPTRMMLSWFSNIRQRKKRSWPVHRLAAFSIPPFLIKVNFINTSFDLFHLICLIDISW